MTTSGDSLLFKLVKASFSGLLTILQISLKQTVAARFACIRLWLKPFCVFAPQGEKHIQFARVSKEEVAVHGTPCTVKRTNDPSRT